MPKAQKQPRRFLASCRLCRSMKLRCNGEQPCSNCAIRRVFCEKEPRSGTPATTSFSDTSPQPSNQIPSDGGVLARLQRLEELVLQNHCATEQRGSLDEPGQTSDSPPYIPEGEGDAKWLESVGSRDDSVVPDWSNVVLYRIISLDEALRTDAIGDSATTSAVNGCADVHAWLPPKDEGAWMLGSYAEHAAFLHHVVHVPSVRGIMDDLYHQLSLGSNPKPNHAALLLSIFASTAYMLSSHATGFHYLNQQDATKCAFVWSKTALNLFEHSSRSTQGSIEDIQAAIILSFVVFNFEGYTMRFRQLSSRALTMARDISLHRIDADANRSHERPIEIEIKRRVWYHIVSTDWLQALSGGPQEGTYLIHPKHMRVNYPRHINDVDLDNDDKSRDPPLSKPTSMTYSLLRIRLAQICCTVVDDMPPSFSDWGSINYSTIILLDQKFEKFLRDIPSFFSLKIMGREQGCDIDRQFPYIAFQRYILATSFHSRRFKLHQPFLCRVSSTNSCNRRHGQSRNVYENSRNVCLESARTVIGINRQLQNDTTFPDSTHIRLTTFLHALFLATAVLVMDLCINKTLTTDSQHLEVAEACNMLRAAKTSSPVASRFLKSLTDVLHKYRVQLSPGETIPSPKTAPTSEFAAATSAGGPKANANHTTHETHDIEELWRDLIDFDNHDAMCWDNLFSDLDAKF